MRQSIVILEDNSDRIAVMDDCLADKFPFFQRQFFRTAPAAIAWLADNLSQAACISLDHDLEPMNPGDPDPGTGRYVADFLATSSPQCPLIIHSTNRLAVDGMEMALSDRGWSVDRIMPYDNCRWIAEAWLPMVRQAIVGSAIPRPDSLTARANS
jgi:hypothetical protein